MNFVYVKELLIVVCVVTTTPNLMPLVFFAGKQEERLTAKKLQAREEFLKQIMESDDCVKTNDEMISKAILSLFRRSELCTQSGGCHFDE